MKEVRGEGCAFLDDSRGCSPFSLDYTSAIPFGCQHSCLLDHSQYWTTEHAPSTSSREESQEGPRRVLTSCSWQQLPKNSIHCRIVCMYTRRRAHRRHAQSQQCQQEGPQEYLNACLQDGAETHHEYQPAHSRSTPKKILSTRVRIGVFAKLTMVSTMLLASVSQDHPM